MNKIMMLLNKQFHFNMFLFIFPIFDIYLSQYSNPYIYARGLKFGLCSILIVINKQIHSKTFLDFF